MRSISAVFFAAVVILTSLVTVFAQSTPAGPTITVPRLIQITGVFQPVDGQPPAGVEVVTVSIYSGPDGGLPVWQERQTVAVEKTGRFALLLGASYPDGIPAEVFGAGQAQWMSLLFERLGEAEQPRVRIASVPYALKASDAETLGGLPASAYLRTPNGDSASVATGDTSLAGTSMDASGTEAVVLPGTTNFLAKYVNGADVGNSAVFETPTATVPTGAVGIGTTTPVDVLHLRFMNPNGGITGLAVQNLASTATSYSGMLFYDQNGALGQFQGFNNTTHEYRINNIGRNLFSQFDGSINFMIGFTSRFLVAPSGNIGIGTTAPSSTLELSNVASPSTTGSLLATTFMNNDFSSLFVGRKARGTPAAPSAVLIDDQLAFFGGRGFGTTSFSNAASGLVVRAAQNWTDLAQGTRLQFVTANNGTTAPTVKMTLDHSGYLNVVGGLGIGTPIGDASIELVKSGFDGRADVFATSFSGPAQFLTRAARGTTATPAPVQSGDALGLFGGGGRATSGFAQFRAGIALLAAENWTDTAQGALLAFGATPIGSTTPVFGMGLLPNGSVGIGTSAELPTVSDRFQVFGDIRVGTTGANGCLKNFAGGAIAGTCASDRRYKKDITPFSPVLDQLTALQPVHYFWRAADFPQQNFGNSRAYGLIAQDVEQVLPELVVTNEDGFKAVDYTKLPLLTIQAVKELKAENEELKAGNEELKAGNEALKQRVDELERLFRELTQSLSQTAKPTPERP